MPEKNKQKKLGVKKVAFTLFILMLVLITVYSITPEDTGTDTMSYNAFKLTSTGFILHIAAYGVTTLMMVIMLSRSDSWLKNLMVLSLLMYSFLLECVQYMLPYRTFNWLDVVANILGIMLVVQISSLFLHKYRSVSE